MRSVTMAAGSVRSSAQGAVDPTYRTNMDILTRRGGIFWGVVLLIVGVVWLAGSLRLVALDFDLLLPLLVILAGVYLLMTKLVR